MSNDTLNKAYLVLLYALLGFGGSLFTALVIGALAYSLARLATGRLQWTTDRMAWSIALAGFAYYLSGALMVALRPGDDNLSLLWERAPFLVFLPLFAQMCLSERDGMRRGLETGALIGAFGLAVWIAVELVRFPGEIAGFRAHGPSGNPGPLATTAAFLFAVNLFAIAHTAGWQRLLAASGALLAALAVGLSLMRTLLPALVLIPILCLVAFPRFRQAALRPASLALFAVGLALFVAIAGSLIAGRIEDVLAYIADSGLRPSATDSLGQRFAMWACAWDAFELAPLFGLGRAGAQAFLTGCALGITGEGLVYTHYHNAALTALAFGGVIELGVTLALLLVPAYWAWRHRAAPEARYGCALIAAVLIIYGLNGLANIMLDHDIHDALYIHATTIGLVMIALSGRPPPDDSPPQDQAGDAG